MTGSDKEFNEQYAQLATVYDEFSNHLFEMVYENESEQRGKIASFLGLNKGDKVIEVSCGTGLNVAPMIDSVGKSGEIHLLDLSKHMLVESIKKFNDKENVFYYLGNGSNLPFRDETFDHLVSVGGINTFTDIESAINEFMRVTKKGGKIIISDEGMQDNLLKTQYGKDGIRMNGLYKSRPPLDKLPINSRDINISYIGGGFFYIISFVKGDDYQFNWELKVPMSNQTVREEFNEMIEKHGKIE